MADDPKFRFGARVVNVWASMDNPHRKGIFVREGFRAGKLNHGKFFQVTDGKGEFWEVGPNAIKHDSDEEAT